jgi:hypothetical protein
MGEAEIYRLLARAGTIWGMDQIEDAAVRRLLMTEWHDALSWWPFEVVNEALSRLRDKSKWWPKVAEVLADIRANLPPAAPARQETAPAVSWSPEEAKRRSEVIQEAKRRYGWKPEEAAPEGPILEPRVFDVPVSDVSETLKGLRRKG